MKPLAGYSKIHDHRGMDQPRFRNVITFPVRFSDLDAMGHVNNARYLTFFEEGRAAWFRECIGMAADSTAYPVIVARIEIDYVAPIPLGVQVRVQTRCARVGNRSLDFDGRIVILDANDTIAARYKAVLVWYDYATGETGPVPDAVRAQIQGYEGM